MKKIPRSLKEMLAGSDLIDPKELALGLRVSRPTIYSWVSRGIVPHVKMETVVRFEPREIEAWLKARRQGPGTVTQCPYNGTIGADFDDFEECRSCPVKQACCELAAQRVQRRPYRVVG